MIAQAVALKRTGPLAPPAVGPGQRPLVARRGDRINYYERIVLPPRQAAGVSAPVQQPQEPTVRDMGDTSSRESEDGHQWHPAPATRITGLALLLAALQLVVGYQWLVSGVDKLLDGTFPEHLGSLITSTAAGGRLPDFFAQLLQQVVLPNSYTVGWMVQLGETLTGVGLITGALFAIVGPGLRARLMGAVSRRVLSTVGVLTLIAVLASLAMAVNYYLLDGLPIPWFQPDFAYGGAIDSSLLLALFSLVILLGRVLSTQPQSRHPKPTHMHAGLGADRRVADQRERPAAA